MWASAANSATSPGEHASAVGIRACPSEPTRALGSTRRDDASARADVDDGTAAALDLVRSAGPGHKTALSKAVSARACGDAWRPCAGGGMRARARARSAWHAQLYHARQHDPGHLGQCAHVDVEDTLHQRVADLVQVLGVVVAHTDVVDLCPSPRQEKKKSTRRHGARQSYPRNSCGVSACGVCVAVCRVQACVRTRRPMLSDLSCAARRSYALSSADAKSRMCVAILAFWSEQRSDATRGDGAMRRKNQWHRHGRRRRKRDWPRKVRPSAVGSVRETWP